MLTNRHPDITRMVRIRPVQDGLLGSILHHVLVSFLTRIDERTKLMPSFRGTPSGKGSHDEVARRIALNGQCWVERSMFQSQLQRKQADIPAWRRDDLQAYMFRLYLEYARLISPDRDNGKMVRLYPPIPERRLARRNEYEEGTLMIRISTWRTVRSWRSRNRFRLMRRARPCQRGRYWTLAISPIGDILEG